MKRAVIYARVSTARQAAEELPIEGQIEHCRNKAAALDAEVLQVFVDPGISGREESRGAFQNAVAYAEAYDVDYLITWSTARFVRDVFFSEMYLRRLDRAGVKVIYCTADIDRSTTGGYITSVISALFDEVYSRNIAADTTRSMMKNARDGFWNGGTAPFGYRVISAPENAKRRKLQTFDDEAWIVAQMFEWRAAGLGARAIAARLNASGFSRRGKTWSSSTVHAILRNPVVTGQIRFGRRPRGNEQRVVSESIMVKSHPAIVPDQTWFAVQALMDGAAPRAEGSPLSTHLFTGLLRCGDCGAAMHMETAKGRSRRYSYYTCSAWIKGKACRPNRRSAPDLDDWLIQVVMERVFTDEALEQMAAELHVATSEWARARRDQMRSLDGDLADLGRRRGKLLEVLETHGRDTPNLGDLTSRLHDLTARTRLLTNQRADLELDAPIGAAAIEAQTTALREVLREIAADRSDVGRTRRLLQKLLDSVVLHSDRVEVNYGTNLLAGTDKQVVPSNVHMAPRSARSRNRVIVFDLPAKLRRAA